MREDKRQGHTLSATQGFERISAGKNSIRADDSATGGKESRGLKKKKATVSCVLDIMVASIYCLCKNKELMFWTAPLYN